MTARPLFAPAAATAQTVEPRGLAEARRRFAVRLILLIYVLALVEGPLRKWFLPELATPAYFLRDPFVAVLYAYCLQHRLFAWGRLGQVWVGFAVATSLLALVPFAVYSIDLRAWPLGVRTYWLWMPLAFAVAGTFRRDDVEHFLRWNVILALPYALLVALQYNSGPSAWVNRGIGGDTDATVGVAGEIIRPFGLFTYTGPNVYFTGAMVAFFVAWYLMRGRGVLRGVLLLAGAIGVGTMAILTGSRAIYFVVAAILLTTIGGSTLATFGFRALARSVGIAAFVFIAALLFVYVFPDMLAAMDQRFENAARSEGGSIWRRVRHEFFSFLQPVATAPFLGYGMGTGTSAIAAFLGIGQWPYGEPELQRVVNELGPILGLSFVALRFATVGAIAVTALGAARRGEAWRLPLVGYASVNLAYTAITNSSLNGFLPWLAVGLVFAMLERSSPSAIPKPDPEILSAKSAG